MSKTLFRKASLESISSPEQLNDYIKVSTPSIWIVLSALFILLTSVFVWGFVGSLPTTVNIEGVAVDGHVICYVNTYDSTKIKIGQTVNVASNSRTEIKGQVSRIGDIPLSAAEIASELNSDYLVQALASGEFAVKITIVPDGSPLTNKTLLKVSIVTESVRPIDFLLG